MVTMQAESLSIRMETGMRRIRTYISTGGSTYNNDADIVQTGNYNYSKQNVHGWKTER